MVKISKNPITGIGKQERKAKLAKIGYDVSENKYNDKFAVVKKRRTQGKNK